MEHKNESYDFEERAAIREFDGDQPRGTAEFFAHEEIAARIAQQGCLTYRQQYEKEQQNKQKKLQQPAPSGQPEKQEILTLRNQRDEVGSRMRAETNKQRKNELMTEWMNLTTQIIELRKGA